VTSALDRLEISRLCQTKFELLSVKEFRTDSPLSTRKDDSCKDSPRRGLVALRCRVTPTIPVLEFQPDSLSRRSQLVKAGIFKPVWATSFLTAATLKYAIGAGITAAAGTRLALQWLIGKVFTLSSFQSPDPEGPELLFLVTTSPSWDWVIGAPVANLGCDSRLSGSLSGVEP